MLCAADNKLEELVIETLAAHPRLNAKALHSLVSSRSRKFSIQAVYQELRKLERGGVVSRKRGLYSLRILWLVEMSELMRSAYEQYLRSKALLNEIPDTPGKTRWVFSNLRQLLDLWTELTFLLVPKVPVAQRALLEYVDHIWFHTANPVNEAHFVRAMKRERVRYALVCRGKTYLDTTYRDTVRRLGGDLSLGAEGFPAKEGTYFSLIGDYIIEVRLSAALARSVRQFYRQMREQRDLGPQALLQFAASRGRCSLELIFSPEHARRERRKFERFFSKTF